MLSRDHAGDDVSAAGFVFISLSYSLNNHMMSGETARKAEVRIMILRPVKT